MKLTRREVALLLEAAEGAAHYYNTFLLHDGWEESLTPEQVAEAKARLLRFHDAIVVARALVDSTKTLTSLRAGSPSGSSSRRPK